MTATVVPTLRYAIGDVVCPGDRLGTTRHVQAGQGTRADIVSALDRAGGQATDAPSSATTKATTHTQERRLYATVVGRLQVGAAAATPTSTVEDPSDEDHDYEDDNDQASATLSSSSQPLFTCSVQEEPSLTSTVIAPPQRLGRRRLPLLASSYIPRVGQLVVGTILRITPQNAVVQLLVLEGVGPITHLGALEGTIKRDDVTADSAVVTETLATKDTTMTSGSGSTSSNSSSSGIIERAFQPTDIISCRIVSVSSGDASNRQRCYDLSTAEVELGVVSATCKVCPRPATTSFTPTPTTPSTPSTGTPTVARLVPISWREMRCTVCGRIEPRKVAKTPGN